MSEAVTQWVRASDLKPGDEIVGPSQNPWELGVVANPHETCKYPSEDHQLIGFEGDKDRGIAVQSSMMFMVRRASEPQPDETEQR